MSHRVNVCLSAVSRGVLEKFERRFSSLAGGTPLAPSAASAAAQEPTAEIIGRRRSGRE
jgi:hypothetical protein